MFLFFLSCSSQILAGPSGPSPAPQKGKEAADSENLEVWKASKSAANAFAESVFLTRKLR